MLRRIWKWVKRIVFGVIALAMLAVIAVVILLHTDWGREQVRKRVEAVLRDQFPGGARIGVLSGSIFGTLTVEQLELDGADGKPLISVGKLDVRAELLPLLWKTVRVDSAIASDVTVDWRAQPSKPPAPTTEPKQPTPWSIDLRGIEVHRGHFALAGTPVTLDGLELLGASFALPSGAPLALTASLHGIWVERKAPVNATISFQLDGGIPVVPSGSITIGGVSITATSVRGESGNVVVQASAAAVAALEPSIALPGDVYVQISADAAHRIDISGGIGPAPIEGTVQLEKAPFRAWGTIGTHDVDLDAITRGKIYGTGSGVVTFVTDGKEAHGTIIAIPRVADLPADTIVINANGTAAGGHVIVFATGPGDLRVVGAADITRASVTRSNVVASIDDPSFFVPGLTGALRTSLTASGAFASLAFTGTATGRGVRFNDASVSQVRASFSGRVAKPRPYGVAHVDLSGIANAGAAFGSASVDAKDDSGGTIALTVHAQPRPEIFADLDATMVPRPGGVSIDLGTHRIDLPTMLWSGQGGHVDVLPDRVVLTDLHTSAGQGGADIAATYRKADKDLVASVALTQIELEEMVPTMSGHVDGTASIEKRGAKWSGKADVTGTGIIARGDLLPADAELHAVLAGRELTAKATAANGSIGGTDLELDAIGPVNPFDIAGWKRVPRADLRRLAVTLHKIKPGIVDPRASGSIDGSLVLTPTDSKGTFEIRGVTLPREMGMVDVDMTVVPAPDNELGVVAQAHVTDVGTVDMGARLAVPDALFDVPSWRALGRHALQSVSAQIDEVAVTPAMLARFHVDAPYHGRAMVQLAAGPGAEQIKLGADIAGLMGGTIVKGLDVHADLATSPDGTSAFLNTSASMKEILSLSAQAPVTTDQWFANGWAGAKLATLVGKLEIPSASAVDILAIVGRTHLTRGLVEGNATIGGTLGTPTAHATLAAHDVAVAASLGDRAPPVLQELTAVASWGGAAGSIEITGTEAGGGTLHATASGDPRALADGKGHVDIANLDLVPIAAFLPGPYVSLAGVVAGNVDVTGFDPAVAKLRGKLTISKGRIPISPTIGTLQNTDLAMTLLERQVKITLDADLGVNHDLVRNVHADATGDLSKLTVTARLHQVSPINAIQPIIDADVVATLAHGAQWTGQIDVRHGHIFVPSKKGTKLLSSSTPDDLVFVDQPTPIAKTFIRPAPEHPSVAVHVTLHSTLIEVEDIARTTITGQLDVTLGGGGIGLLGAVDASGSADLFDRHYDIDHGSVSFDGTMDGLINVRLVHDFADLTLTADIGGRVSDPQIELSSTPATYTRGQLLGFFLGGEPGGDPTAQTQDAAVGAASSVASTILGSKVKKVVPFGLIDVLKCDAGTSASSASCTVGIWITKKLFGTYKANLDARPDQNRNEGEFQYYLKRSILLDLIGGDNSYHSLDVLWRIHW